MIHVDVISNVMILGKVRSPTEAGVVRSHLPKALHIVVARRTPQHPHSFRPPAYFRAPPLVPSKMAAALLSSPIVAGVQAPKAKFVSTPKVNPTVHGLGAALKVKAEDAKVAKVDRSKDTLFFADENSLTYLDGTLPGDYGFDPFGLLEPGNGDVGFINPSWLRYSEVIHGRFAMLGAAGCITPEILSSLGVIPESTGIVWYRNGVIPPAGSSDVYWVDPYTLFFVEVVAMQFAELRRLQDYRNPGSMGKQYFLGLEGVLGGSGDPSYPGGAFFNMFNLGKTEESMKVMKTREIKNGRLAMMAMFGFGAQAILTGKGPYQNLLDHLSDPFNNNILTNWTSVYGQL